MKLNCFPLFDLCTWPEPVSLCSSSSAVCIKTETCTHNWQSVRIRNFRTCTQGNSFILDLRFVPFSFLEHCFCENELTHFFSGWIDRGSKPCAHGGRVSGRSHGSFESLRLYEQRSFKEKEEKETKINQLFNFMYKLKAAVIFRNVNKSEFLNVALSNTPFVAVRKLAANFSRTRRRGEMHWLARRFGFTEYNLQLPSWTVSHNRSLWITLSIFIFFKSSYRIFYKMHVCIMTSALINGRELLQKFPIKVSKNVSVNLFINILTSNCY